MEKIVVLVLSVAAGLIGTGIGGVIGALAKNKSSEKSGDMLTFAAGTMLGVVAFEMIGTAMNLVETLTKRFFVALIVLGCVLLGITVAYLLNIIVEKLSERHKTTALECRNSHFAGMENSGVEILKHKRDFGLKKAGVITLLAIAFHNVPEGMAIGASGVSNLWAGAVVALIIALHNVPEGMAISAPLVSGGVKKSRAVAMSILAGLATLIGAIVGVFVGEASPVLSAASISLAAGAMIYVSIFDLLPVGTALKGGFSAFSFFAGLLVAMILSLLF